MVWIIYNINTRQQQTKERQRLHKQEQQRKIKTEGSIPVGQSGSATKSKKAINKYDILTIEIFVKYKQRKWKQTRSMAVHRVGGGQFTSKIHIIWTIQWVNPILEFTL